MASNDKQVLECDVIFDGTNAASFLEEIWISARLVTIGRIAGADEDKIKRATEGLCIANLTHFVDEAHREDVRAFVREQMVATKTSWEDLKTKITAKWPENNIEKMRMVIAGFSEEKERNASDLASYMARFDKKFLNVIMADANLKVVFYEKTRVMAMLDGIPDDFKEMIKIRAGTRAGEEIAAGLTLENVKTYLFELAPLYSMGRTNRMFTPEDRHDATRRQLWNQVVPTSDTTRGVLGRANGGSNRAQNSGNASTNANESASSTPLTGREHRTNEVDPIAELTAAVRDLKICTTKLAESRSRPQGNRQEQGQQRLAYGARCLYCDDTEHVKRNCQLLTEDLRKGVVRIGDRGRIVGLSGEELPANTGHGGIRARVMQASANQQNMGTGSNAVSLGERNHVVQAITLQSEDTGLPDGWAVRWSSLLTDQDEAEMRVFLSHLADGGREKLAAELWETYAAEKRAAEDAAESTATEARKRFRPWEENSGGVSMDGAARSCVRETATPRVHAGAGGQQGQTRDEHVPMKKRGAHIEMSAMPPNKLASTILASTINERMGLTIADVLANAPEARNALADQVRQRLVPIAGPRLAPRQHAVNVGSIEARAQAPRAAPTSQVLAKVNGWPMWCDVDSGSQITVVSEATYRKIAEGLGLRDAEDEKMNGASDGMVSSFVGILQDVPVTVGSTSLLVPMYVVRGLRAECLLGRNWQMAVSFSETVDVDGSSVITLTHPETRVREKVKTKAKGYLAIDIRQVATERDGLCCGSVSLMASARPVSLMVGAARKTVANKVKPQLVQIGAGVPLAWNERPQRNERGDVNKSSSDARMEIGEGVTRRAWPQEMLDRACAGDTGTLQQSDKSYLQSLLRTYAGAFAFNPEERGTVDPCLVPPMKIRTVPHVPWQERTHPVPRALLGKVIEMLKDRLKTGVLEPSASPYANKWFVIIKKDGSLRFIQDLRPLNAVTVADAGTPPHIDELTEQHSGYPIYATLDATAAYDQLLLDEGARDMTAMRTPMGLVRMTRLPMGGTNSVAHFQTAMTRVFKDVIGTSGAVFLDDLVVHGIRKDIDKNARSEDGVLIMVKDLGEQLEKALIAAEKAGLTFSPTKIQVGLTSISLLGVDCGEYGRRPSKNKVEKALQWSEPKNIKEVRGFLGLAGFYRQFVKGFATIAEPLNKLTRKETGFVWGDDQKEAMRQLQQVLSSYPVLRSPRYGDPSRPLIVTTDAGPAAGGGVLGQENNDGKRYACRFVSFSFTPTQRRYAQIKRELLAIVRTLKELRMYVYGQPIIVETDCAPLIGLLKEIDVVDPVLSRWQAYIRLFAPEFRHVAGKNNVVADALSRKEHEETGADIENMEMERQVDKTIGAVSMEKQVNVTTRARSREESAARVQEDDAVNDHGSVSDESDRENENDVQGDEDAAVNEEPRRATHLQSVLPEHEELWRAIAHLLRGGGGAELVNSDEKRKLRKKAGCYVLRGGHLFRRPERRGDVPRRVLQTVEERAEALNAMHEDGGHRGEKATLAKVGGRYWWPKMGKDVRAHVSSCGSCQRRARAGAEEPLHPSFPQRVGETWQVDLQQLPKGKSGKTYIIEARCVLSGWIEARTLRSKKAGQWLAFVEEELVSRHGACRIISDHGELDSSEAKEFAAKHGIMLTYSAAYHPMGNAVVERGHVPIADSLSKACGEDKRDWEKYFLSAIWADRTTVRRSTGYTPFFLMFGREAVVPFELSLTTWATIDGNADRIWTTEKLIGARAKELAERDVTERAAASAVERSRSKGKERFDKKHKTRKQELEPGQLVLLKTTRFGLDVGGKLSDRWVGPYRVIAQQGGGTYRIAELDGAVMRGAFAGRRLKEWHSR